MAIPSGTGEALVSLITGIIGWFLSKWHSSSKQKGSGK